MKKVHISKGIAHLIEAFSSDKRCKLNKVITSIDGGVGTKMATKILYMRMLNRATDIAHGSNNDQLWIDYPRSGLSRPNAVKDWMVDNENQCSMDSADLLLYASASTYRNAVKHLIESGLVLVDRRNRMHIKYPHPETEKMLSLSYAKTAILFTLKNVNNDNDDDTEQKAEKNDEIVNEVQSEFWT